MLQNVFLIAIFFIAFGAKLVHPSAFLNHDSTAKVQTPFQQFQQFRNSENMAHCECGKPISIHRDNWQLYLYVITTNSGDSAGPVVFRVCAATIISTDIVVASAQCTLNNNQNSDSSSDNFQHYDESQLRVSPFLRNSIPKQQFKVIQTYYVRDIRHVNGNGDVLLMKLQADFSRDDSPHRPICLPRESDLTLLTLDYLYHDKTGVTYTYQLGQRYLRFRYPTQITMECADDHPATVSKYNASHGKLVYAGKLFGSLVSARSCSVEGSTSTETSICHLFEPRAEYLTVLCGTPLMHTTAEAGSPVLLIGITCNQTQYSYLTFHDTIFHLVTVMVTAIREAANSLDTSWCFRPEDQEDTDASEYSLRHIDGGYSSTLSDAVKYREGTQSFARYYSIQSGITWNPTTGGSWESLPTAQSIVKSMDCSCGLANTDVRYGGRASRDFLSGRIINGVTATPYEFGWVVKIIIDNAFLCTGSIINDRMVLTAAHCVGSKDQQLNYAPEKISVMINIHKSDGDENSFIAPVQDVVHHPGKMFTFQNYDIAVLILKNSLTFVGDTSKGIRPICVTDEYFMPEVDGVITGFGLTHHENPQTPAKVLQKAHVKIWSRDECQRRLPERDACVVLENNVCVYDYDGGKQVHMGDSGGPAMAKDSDGKYHQLGVCNSGAAIFNEKDWTWKPVSIFVNPRKFFPFIYHVSNLAGAKWCRN